MSKKTVKTTTTREEEDREINPIPKLIKSYLFDGEEFADELRNVQFKIHVQRFTRDGRPIPVAGRVYDNLEELPYQLGSRFGSSRFRLIIKAFDGEGAQVAFVRIEDYPIEWDGEEEPEEADHPTTETSLAGQIELAQLKHNHEKELKQMEMQKEMFVAAINAKSGGGMKVGDMLELLKTGITLGSGRDLPAETNGDSDDPLMSIINGPLGQILAKALTQKMIAPPAQAAAPPQPPVDQMPVIPSLET